MHVSLKPAADRSADAPCPLSVRGLTIRRRVHGKDTGGARPLVLEDVSFSAQAGEMTAILGNAGSGKTSLLAGIAGLVKSERGAVLVGGIDVSSLRAARRGIGFLPPGVTLEEGRSLADALRRVVTLPRRDRDSRPQAVLTAFGLPPGRAAGSTTHGEGFAALAAARLLPNQPVLLVDEAGCGLDQHGATVLVAQLRQQAGRGRTVLLATRDPAIALAADHLVLLDAGHVLQTGTPASVYTEPRNEAAALLTGPANILHGTLRQKLPGAAIWVAAGQRFTQADSPGQPAPALGTPVTLCLRPAQVTVWSPALPNRLPAQVTALTCLGDRTALQCDTALGMLTAFCETPSSVRPGMSLDLGWTSQGASVLSASPAG